MQRLPSPEGGGLKREVAYCSLHADSTSSLKRSEVPPPVVSAHQRHKACPKSRGVPRLEAPDLIGGKRSPLFYLQVILVIILMEKDSMGRPKVGFKEFKIKSKYADSLCVADSQTLLEEKPL